MSATTNSPVETDFLPLTERPAALVRVLGEQPFHTDGDLLGFGFARDGTLWSVEDPGVLRQWDLTNSRQLAWHPVDDLGMLWAFSPSCRWIASGSDDVSVWEVANGQINTVLTTSSWVTALAFTPGEDVVASGHDDGIVRVWTLESEKLLFELAGHKRPVSALAFSADGRYLASAGEDKRILLWDMTTGKQTGELLGHKDRIPALVWHPTLPRLISAAWDTTARVWDTQTCEPIILLNSHSTQVHTLAIQPQGELLACADSSRSIRLWDLNRFRELRVWPEQPSEVQCLAFAPDGQRLVTGGSDRVIQVRDVREDWAAPTLPQPIAARATVAVSPDSQRVYSVGGATPLRVWDRTTERSVLQLNDAAELRAFALSPNGKFVAGSMLPKQGTPRGTPLLGLWDTITGERKFLLEGPWPAVTTLAFSPDNKILASGSYESSDVWLWDLTAGEPLLLIPMALEGCSVEGLAFHPTDPVVLMGGIDYMATGGSDGVALLWDMAARAMRPTNIKGLLALSLHPSGERIAICTLHRSIQIWQWPGDKELAEVDVPADAVTSLAYSPDGKWLACGADDNAVRLYDAQTLKLVGQVQLDTQIRGLGFTPDSETIFTANANTSCYELSVETMIREG